jgi:hypothetical protein
MAGTVVRNLSLGRGVNLTDFTTDFNFGNTRYFISWDGTNDTKALVKNGIYLVRYIVKLPDGSSTTDQKVVALIK